MGVTVTGSPTFELHPAGPYSGVCVDVIDLGVKITKFGPKPHVRIVWQTEHEVTTGDGDKAPAIVMTTMTKTIGKDSNLRKLLESWRGKPFTDHEIEKGFDVETLVGVPCALNIVHRVAGENKYANVATVMRLMKGVPPLKPTTDYLPFLQRPAEDQAAYLARFRGEAAVAAAPRGIDVLQDEDEDDDLPF